MFDAVLGVLNPVISDEHLQSPSNQSGYAISSRAFGSNCGCTIESPSKIADMFSLSQIAATEVMGVINGVESAAKQTSLRLNIRIEGGGTPNRARLRESDVDVSWNAAQVSGLLVVEKKLATNTQTKY